MPSFTARAAAAAAVATVAALLTSPASATPTWVNAPDVANTGNQVTQLHVETVPADPGPAASVLVWVNANTDNVVVSSRPAGGAWTDPVALAKPSSTPHIETVRP